MAAHNQPTLTGTWHNEHGSVLHVVEDGARLHGTFRPAVGLAKGQTFQVVGVVTSHCFAFVVGFGVDASVTSWVGHIRHDVNGYELDTLWTMAVDVCEAVAPGESWKGTWCGADRFRPGEPALARRSSSRPSSPLAR
jgi:hypothetical protein